MPKPRLEFLSEQDIDAIHSASLRILDETGMAVYHSGVLLRLAEAGFRVVNKRVYFRPEEVMHAIHLAGKQYILYGRNPQKTARFGYGDFNMISTPGQFAWFDWHTGERRSPCLADTRQAARLGDALPNITIVGAMTVPVDAPGPVRDVVTTAELVRNAGKPTRCWPITRRSSHYVLEIYSLLAGGKAALAHSPMVETFLEPISPLSLPETGLDVMLEFLEYRQPVAIGPMSMTTATSPGTLAGTLAQENAEILGALTVVQALSPGTPILYGGIPHIMDPRTSICSFGSPEQGIMAAAMAQIAHSYELPVYINTALTDSKVLDAQAGIEKVSSLLMGMLVGADLLNHSGIVGTDHGASLPWLAADNEAASYVKRVTRGFTIDPEHLAVEVVAEAGPAKDYLSHEHTLRHYREEIWIPGKLWTRDPFDVWAQAGGLDMHQRAVRQVDQILSTWEPEPLDPAVDREIDRIVETAKREILGS